MSKARKVLEAFNKRSKISEGYATSDKMNIEAQKEILAQNKDRNIGDTVLNIKGVEIKDSVLLFKGHNSIDFAVKTSDGISISIGSELKDQVYTFELSKKELQVLKTLF